MSNQDDNQEQSLEEMKAEYRARASWLIACEERGGPRASMQAFDECERACDDLRARIERAEKVSG